MKILFVIDSFFTGGAEFSTLEIVRFLKENGIQISVCKLKNKEPQYDASLFGLDISDVFTLPSGCFWTKRKALQKSIQEFKPDIIHSVLFNANMMVRSIRVFDKSFIHLESLVNHSYSSERLKDPRVKAYKLELHRWFNMITARFGTDHFHPNGVSVMQHFHEKLFISPKKMTLVYRGRNSKNYEVSPAFRTDLGIQNDKIILINVGRQDFQKGHDLLVESFASLPNSIKEKIVILIVGREGNATSCLQRLIVKKKLEKTILFLGHRTDIPSLLKMADIFVFPSRFEGLPGALIEAEAAGLPIICSHLPMMLEVVEPNQNAITFDINKIQDLTDAITLMINDSNLRFKFGQKSRALFEERFQLEAVHQSMMVLYTNLMGK
jgi:glycosyltransferase involved in cell wall biosynthesis